MTTDSENNKRRHSRVVFPDPVQVTLLPNQERHWYLLGQDLSEGGIQIWSPETFAVGMRLLLGIEVDAVAEPIRAIGKVMWVVQAGYQDTYRLGIEFLEVDESQRERLLELVADRAKAGQDDKPIAPTPPVYRMSPGMTDLASERRVHVRVRSSHPVQASSMINVDRDWHLLSLDLSEGGMQLLSTEPFAVGARLLCELEADPASEPIRVVGRVARCEAIDFQERYTIGLEFLEVDDAVRKRLRELLEVRETQN